MYKRILVPLDGSPLAEEALAFAERLVHDPSQEIYLLRVVEPRRVVVENAAVPISYPGGMLYTGLNLTEEEMQAQLANAGDYVKSIAERLVSRGYGALPRALLGKPADTIIAYSNDAGMDIIVIGTRGNSGFKRMVLGSVCDEVIRSANVPVLVVTPREARAERAKRAPE